MKRIDWLACEYGRYGYRRITVERIWRPEGLKVQKNFLSGVCSGSMTDLAFGSVRLAQIMCGVTFSLPTGPHNAGVAPVVY